MPVKENPRSFIASERLVTTPPWFWPVAAALAAATFLALVVLARAVPSAALGPEHAYTARGEGAIVLRVLYTGIGLEAARIVAAACTAGAVLATAAAGLRLFKSAGVGLLAATLLALDPSVLLLGHLASGFGPVLGLVTGTLALHLGARRRDHALGGTLLFFATLLHPGLVLWSFALLALVLLRGHIYGAPKYLGLAAAVTVGPALLGMVFAQLAAVGAARGLNICTDGGAFESLILAHIAWVEGGRFALPNAVTWFGGAAVLGMTSTGALAHTAGTFRMQRLPGRIHLRLPERLGRMQGRALWLLLLVVLLPVPSLWVPMFALAIGAGVRGLADDARAFGILLGVLLVGFALMNLSRVWGLVDGSADLESARRLLGVVPWVQGRAC